MHTLRTHAAFIGILIALVVANIAWIQIDQSPALWDIAGHSERAAEMAQLIRGGHFGSVLTLPGIYPPVAYLVTAVLFTLFGMHSDIPQYSLLIWLVACSVSLYAIGLKLFQRRDVATLAVFFCFASPLFAHFTRIYDLDFPLAAIVTAAIAALLHTEKFTNKKWTVLFGVLVGIALLTKWTAFIFLVAPTLCVLLPAFRTRYEHRRKIHHLTFAVVTALIIAAPWYVTHAQEVLATAAATRKNVFSVPFENLFSVGNITFYTQWIVRGLTWPLATAAALGLCATFLRRKFADGLLLLWVAVPYIIMTFALYSKESRYLLPIFPALALLTAALIIHLKPKKQFAFAIISGGIALIFWMQTSWNIPVVPHSTFAALKLQNTYGLQTIAPDKPYFGFTYPTHYATNIPEVITAIIQDLRPENYNGTVHITVVPNSVNLTAQQIQFAARLAGLDSPTKVFQIDYSTSSKIRNIGWESIILESDYLITKTGDQGPLIWGPQLPKIATAEKRNDRETFGQFELLQSWTLATIEKEPQTMRLYRKISTTN